MKIPAGQIESFVKSPDKNINFVLVYGPDAGLVSEYTRTICKTVVDNLSDPFRVAELSYDRIKEEPAILNDEIHAMSLMGGRRLVKIHTESSALPKELAEVLTNANSDTMVVIAGGDLAPTSTLRSYFEKTANAAAIPCYKDDNAAISRVISNKFAQHKLTYDNDVVQYLTDSFSGDRLVILSEVEKLVTYMGDNKHVTLEDAKECIYDSSEVSLDEICNAFASRNPYETEKNLTRAQKEGVASIAIIRMVLRYFMRLQEIKNQVAGGVSEQQAISALRPPVFFKQVPVLKKHLSLWKPADISRVISRFIELEIDCKTTGSQDELLCARMLTLLPLTIKS
ncbi:MAG: polymerase subunit delta [Rickettsiaceae bacterium]|jgi:DNA polymerase-3 subunit delta|nr:polymerase subunit delta [Rickettsiaceae bacterium]